MREELYIKTASGKWEKVDLSADSNIVLAYKNNLLGRIGTIKSSYSYTISLPKTANNMRIFQFCNLPAVRVINGTKIIGEPLTVRYLRSGMEILGDAVAFLDSVTKEAFEISISFGFLGVFSDWIENENKLNDLGDYNTFIRYDNNLTDYPSSGNIDDLPAIFKPYYDMGVQSNSNIARMPAVKVSYLVEQIEKEVDCTFSFPENVADQIKHLAIPLTNKVLTSEMAGKNISINSGIAIGEKYTDQFFFSKIFPISCGKIILGDKIENVLSMNTIQINSITNNNEIYENLNMSLTGIISEIEQRLHIYFHGEFSYIADDSSSDSNWRAYFVFLEVDENQSAKVISLHNDVLLEKVGKDVTINTGIYNFYVNAQKGYKYGFAIILEENTAFTNELQKSKDNGYSNFGVISRDEVGLCSIDSSLSDAESVGIIPLIPIKGNLPDISQVDFIQSLCDMFGVFPITNPVPNTNYDTGKRIIEFVNLETLFDNIRPRYLNGNVFNDWTDKLITNPQDMEISFTKDGYYQRNYLRYKEDDTVMGDYDVYFDIPDKRLDKEGNLVELPFAASDGDKIIMFSEEKDSNNNITYSFEGFEPRIMSVIKRDDGKCGLTFDGLDFKSLLSKYYSRYIELVQDMYLITVTVILKPLDLRFMDYTYPVYFKQFGRYFGIVEIQSNSNDDNCEVTLLRLSAK